MIKIILFSGLYLVIGYLYSTSAYVQKQLKDSQNDEYLKLPKKVQKVGDDIAQRIVMIFFPVFMLGSLFFGLLSVVLKKIT